MEKRMDRFFDKLTETLEGADPSGLDFQDVQSMIEDFTRDH
jgi:hypothetical protein